MPVPGEMTAAAIATALATATLLLRRRKTAARARAPTISSFEDPRLAWDQGAPGADGSPASWAVDGGELVVVPAAKRDYWSRTFYDPLLVKHDAQTLLAEVPAEAECTLSTGFTLSHTEQFDQAGIMVRVDDGCWVKAGIEFTDGVPRLSCVVTNCGYSDWSTQAWQPGGNSETVAVKTSIRVRVSKLCPGAEQGPSLVFEACAYRAGDQADSPGDWFQVRIASLRSGRKPWRMGVFAICPVANKGCEARFHHIAVGDKCDPCHNAKNPLDAPSQDK